MLIVLRFIWFILLLRGEGEMKKNIRDVDRLVWGTLNQGFRTSARGDNSPREHLLGTSAEREKIVFISSASTAVRAVKKCCAYHQFVGK